MRACSAAAILAAAGVGLTGCSGGAPSVDTAPMAVVRAAQSSIASTGGPARTPRHGARAVRRRSAVPPSGSASGDAPTPAGPTRPRTVDPVRPLPVSAAPRLAAPACAQYVAALVGRYPAPVRARGEGLGLAIVTDSVAAALLGMPVIAPNISLAARERLDDAHARLSRALAAGEAARATAIADETGTSIRAYAGALGIADCG